MYWKVNLTFEQKYDAALKELTSTKMWRPNYLPPSHRLLRKFGLAVRPPHYYSFWQNLGTLVIEFGLLWSAALSLLIWLPGYYSFSKTLFVSAIAAGVHALLMSLVYYVSARINKLPNWDEFPVRWENSTFVIESPQKDQKQVHAQQYSSITPHKDCVLQIFICTGHETVVKSMENTWHDSF